MSRSAFTFSFGPRHNTPLSSTSRVPPSGCATPLGFGLPSSSSSCASSSSPVAKKNVSHVVVPVLVWKRAVFKPIFDSADGAGFFSSGLRNLQCFGRPVVARRRYRMQAKELETLHHASFHPRLQRAKTCFSGFVEDTCSIFCPAAVLSTAVMLQLVVTS